MKNKPRPCGISRREPGPVCVSKAKDSTASIAQPDPETNNLDKFDALTGKVLQFSGRRPPNQNYRTDAMSAVIDFLDRPDQGKRDHLDRCLVAHWFSTARRTG